MKNILCVCESFIKFGLYWHKVSTKVTHFIHFYAQSQVLFILPIYFDCALA